jgi:two-component system nitrate/nitrite response regulator NarL
MRSILSVVIADRRPVVLHCLSNLLDAEQDFRIVARCSDGASCIEAIRIFLPDVAVLDLSMLDMSGLAFLAKVGSQKRRTRLVCFGTSVEERELTALAGVGARSVFLQDQEFGTLAQTLRQIAASQAVWPLASLGDAANHAKIMAPERSLTLTERERQIMHLVSEGLSNKEIGRRLSVSDGTIKVHLHHIFEKLQISNRTSLAALAISQPELTAVSVEDRSAATGKNDQG